MDAARGRILSLHAGPPAPHARVLVAAAGCPRCASGKGCGAGVFAGNGERSVDALIAPGLQLLEGDSVCLELAPRSLLRASLLAFGLPLAGGVTGAVLGYLAGGGDTVTAVAAILGLAGGVGVGRLYLRRSACLREFTPVITARLAGNEP